MSAAYKHMLARLQYSCSTSRLVSHGPCGDSLRRLPPTLTGCRRVGNRRKGRKGQSA